MEDSIFKVEKKGHIAWMILNNPHKRNAMSFSFYDGLKTHFNEIDKDSDIYVVIIKAEGKSFTTGTDLDEFEGICKLIKPNNRESILLKLLQAQQGINSIEECRKPVIAAVHSHCLGAGVDLLCACDVRLATENAVFSIREVRMGFIADVGTIQRLPHIIEDGYVRELVFTGRDFNAAEAHRMGFITRICKDQEELYAEAEKLADQIASCAPLAVQGSKEAIIFSRDKGIRAGLKYVARKNADMCPSEDMMEAFTAFREKRLPIFKGE